MSGLDRMSAGTEQHHRQPVGESETRLSPGDAATLCKVSIDTIRRRLRAGAFPGAERDGDHPWSPWLFPVADLLTAGLCDQSDLEHVSADLNPDARRLSELVAELSAALEAERVKRDSVESRLAQALGEIEHHRRIVERLISQPEAGSTRRSA